MRSKKTEAAEEAAKQIKVLRVHDFTKENEPGCNIACDLEVNGVTIYGCAYREGVKDGKDWRMITFPQKKGSDGNYYKHAFVKFSDADLDFIEAEIDKML